MIRRYENVGAYENVEIDLLNAETGRLMNRFKSRNMIVNTGLNFIREAVSRDVTPMGYIAAGEGSTGVTSADTALESELDRVAVLSYDDTATGAVRFRAIFESNQANGNLQEFGVFNAVSGGIMGAKTVLGSSFTKDVSIMLRVNWTWTFSDT